MVQVPFAAITRFLHSSPRTTTSSHDSCNSNYITSYTSLIRKEALLCCRACRTIPWPHIKNRKFGFPRRVSC